MCVLVVEIQKIILVMAGVDHISFVSLLLRGQKFHSYAGNYKSYSRKDE